MEAVHVALAARIDARDQRHRRRQRVEVGPVDDDPRGARNCRNMDRMVGRSACREQPDARIDDRLFVDAAPERPILGAHCRQPVRRGTGQGGTQRRARIDEGATGHVQPHHLHHHLVRVCGAIEGAGAGRMIRRGLGLEQFGARRLALGEKLANALFFLVGQPRRHRPGGDQDRGQVAEAQRADQQAGDDLVTDAEQRDAVEHAMAQRDRGTQCDRVAAKERQLHADLPLRDAVAHRRHAARDLRRCADFAREDLDLRGIALIGLVRRQHVVERRDDAEIGHPPGANRRLVALGRRKPVREVAARQVFAG